jgi:hypothetical protein
MNKNLLLSQPNNTHVGVGFRRDSRYLVVIHLVKESRQVTLHNLSHTLSEQTATSSFSFILPSFLRPSILVSHPTGLDNLFTPLKPGGYYMYHQV